MSSQTPLSHPMPPRLPVTLIVAATPRTLGIGRNGTLPWRIKSELQYFARVTTRLPPSCTGSAQTQNAVVMGRKTWESIPARFRPLKGRLNVVLSRGVGAESGHAATAAVAGEPLVRDGAVWARDLAGAVRVLGLLAEEEEQGRGMGRRDDRAKEEVQQVQKLPRVARVFVIGGATVYKAALEDESVSAERVLLTKVQGEWGCDTFFPVKLEGEDGERAGWKRKSNEDLSSWVGEEVPEGEVEEGDVRFEYCMFEKDREEA